MAAYAIQNTQGEFKWPHDGHIYFLESSDIVAGQLRYPLKYRISQVLIELLEQIIQLQKNFI